MKHKASFGLVFAIAVLALPLSVFARGYVQDEILVKYRPGSKSAVAASAANRGLKVGKSIDQIRYHVLKLPKGLTVEKAIERLGGNPNVEYVGPNHILRLLEDPPQTWPNDPIFFDGYDPIGINMSLEWPQWGLYNDGYNLGMGDGVERADIHAPEAWSVTTGSPSVIIASIDSGVDPTIEDFACPGKILPGYNTMDNSSNSMDNFGHGTMTAEVAAACSDDYMGIAGVAWGCPVLPVKILEDNESGGTEADIAEGVIWAVDQGARVLNLSVGTYLDVQALHDAIDYAWDHGSLPVCASGNDDEAPVVFPARYSNALAVGASTPRDTRATNGDWLAGGGSNYGEDLDVVAPGSYITGWWYSMWTGERDYGGADGTSLAAPHVSGIAALIWSIHPDWTNAQVKNQIEQTADDKGDPGWDQYYGWGRVNAYRALTEVVGPPPVPIASIRDLRTADQGDQVDLKGKVITSGTGQFANMAYVEEEDRTSGVMVYCPSGVPTALIPNDKVDVKGRVSLRNGEPAVVGTITEVPSTATIRPLGVTGKVASQGATGLAGGLLVKVWGKVTKVGGNYLYVDDGSSLMDHMGIAKGIRVYTEFTPINRSGDNVTVVGLLGMELPVGATMPVPVVRARDPEDIN